jgi:hypothetical protein
MPEFENKGTNSAEGFCMYPDKIKQPWQFFGRRQSRAQEVVVEASGIEWDGEGKRRPPGRKKEERKRRACALLFLCEASDAEEKGLKLVRLI